MGKSELTREAAVMMAEMDELWSTILKKLIVQQNEDKSRKY